MNTIDPTTFEILVRVLAALVLGAAIGLERQVRQRHAGLRTNTLVAIGSALFVALSVTTPDEVSPTRIAAQVVSGIGFLGAGVIMREGSGVRGLNTAATLWCSAAVGTLCGAGLVPLAAVGAGLVVGVNLWLRLVSWRINASQAEEGTEVETAYVLELVCREQDEAALRRMLVEEVTSAQLHLRSLSSTDISPPGRMSIEAEVLQEGRRGADLEKIVSRLCLETGVTTVRWRAEG